MYGLLRIFQDDSQASNQTRAELNHCIADTKLLAEIGKVDIDIVDESLFVVILNAFTELVVVIQKANFCLEKALSEEANRPETVKDTDRDCFARLRRSWDELSREITLLSRWQRLSIARHARLGKLCPGLTANENFVDWQNGKGHLLWCHGPNGVGKTFVLIEYRQAFLDDRKDLLKDIVRCYNKTFLVIDALDEFSDDEAKRMMLNVQQVSQEATAQWKKETDMPLYRYVRLNSEVQQEDNCSTGKKTAYTEHFSLHSTHPLAGPLYWCAEKGSAVGCQLLLPYEEDPNVQFQNEVGQDDTHAFWETALSAAVRYGSPEAVKVHLDDGRVDPNIGRTHYIYGHISPLAQACQDNKKEIIQMLVAREDVDVNAIDRGGYNVGLTPLLWSRTDAAELLLRRKDVDINLMRVGRGPIHHLANLGGSLKALDMLLSKPGMDVNMRTEEEMNYRKDRPDSVEKWNGPERYGSTGSGYRGTPAWPNDFDEQLSWGTKKDHFESIVRELLAAPTIDVNVSDDQGHTSLDYTKWSMEVICQEEHLRLREFDEAIQEAKLEGREPVMSHDEVAAPVRGLLESVTKVQALLLAAGALSGKPIPVPAIIEEGRGSPVFRMRPVNQ
ncbi:ankyrin [Colletotrichum sp. SAR 10_70]|nr:ankyrin [Colletotrichum sp. SAR 10_70]KAI8153846.1 ankyrin [Colletotrichum sp. SAR 10_71]